MPKFRKKPVVIEAWHYTSTKKEKLPEWYLEAAGKGIIYMKNNEIYIKTLEGDHHVSDEDWIIQGVNGELYPCKPDIFEKTYEAVE